MRVSVPMILAVALAACSPAVPDSGVGFNDYPSTAPAPEAGFSTEGAAAAIDQAVSGEVQPQTTVDPNALPADRPRGDAPANIKADSGEMNYATGGVSDEQDFSAVTSRETIASDKARIEANRAQYVLIQPQDLPMRPGDTGPNIVEYALATTNPPGVTLFERPSFYLISPVRSCLKYTSPDLAQQAFLAAGGPQRDSKALDPDGDGFACDWDPRPFRTALK